MSASRMTSSLFFLSCLVFSSCSGASRSKVEFPGTLERETIQVAAPAAQTVVERPLREGDHASEGALLARLDDQQMRAELAIHQASLHRAKAELAFLQAGTRQEQIGQARAELEAAIASAENLQTELNRVHKLFADKLVPENSVDRARVASEEAQARKQQAAERLQELRAGPRGEELAVAEAAVEEMEARLREAQVRLAQLELRSPIDARVEELHFSVGERPAPGDPVVVLSPNSAPYARIFVPTELASQVHPGMEAQIQVPGKAKPFRAKVRDIAQEAMFTPFYTLTESESSRLVYLTRLDLLEPEASKLGSGLPVRVVLLLHETLP